MIDQVEEDKEYALLLSTCAGTWRYLIGDVIRFVNVKDCEIVITGRTKHFLSLCGESGLVKTITLELNINIKEFSVAGIPHETLFAHHWYIGTDDNVNPEVLKARIDHHLKVLNDDYRVERIAALKEIFVDVLSPKCFYQWLKLQGKEGGQNKFPRVLKKKQLSAWREFLESEAALNL